MATFIYNPSYSGTSGDNELKVRTAVFGDGYQQRVGEGINTLKRTWNLNFQLRLADMNAIEAFFIARAGVESFDWTPPSGAAGKWVCAKWGRTPSDGFDTITAAFKEVFGE